jgi:chemotaxis protein methyltransferase CheR
MSAIPRQQLAALSDLVGRWTGLHFPQERYAELERGLLRASKDFGHGSTTAFVNFCLTTPDLTADQVQTLAWHLTIGETYFLRGGQTFGVLEREVLPELLRARKNGERQLRLWSAGCAGGEEPYSLAITVSRLVPDLSDWNMTILATDINTRALQKAGEGVYSNWSFRDTPDWLRPQFFAKTASGDWAIRSEIKRRVTFSYLNLAADPYPSLATNTNAMDIIFCRNVLMYFSADTMRRVVGRLHDALRGGGCLFVAPSEASHEFFPQFERVASQGEIYYRKNGAGALHGQRGTLQTAPSDVRVRPAAAAGGAAADGPATARAKRTPAWRPANPTPGPDKPASRFAPHAKPAWQEPASKDRAPAASAAGPAALAASARRAANEGRLSEALKDCEQAIGADKLSADYRYLQATILGELDREDDAVKALNSTLYLDPRFVLAHFLYGNIARRRSRATEAESHFRTTLSLLEELSPDDVLPESEGMTAGKLAEIVKSILQLEAAP